MLPDKSIAQLVKYYYGWKKTRTRTSLMDRQARKLQVQREQGLLATGTSSAASQEGSGASASTGGSNKDSKQAKDPSDSAAASLDSVLSDEDDDKVNSALGTGENKPAILSILCKCASSSWR